MWDLKGTAPQYVFSGHTDSVTSMCWRVDSDDVLIRTASFDGTVRTWFKTTEHEPCCDVSTSFCSILR